MRNSLRFAVALSGASMFGVAFLVACSDDTSIDPGTEAGVGPDATPDSPALQETGSDAGADTAPPFDGGFMVGTFDDLLATELCKSLARCCYGTPTPAEGGADGGSFDLPACMKTAAQTGFQGSNVGAAQLRDGGNVVIDQVKADDCITKIKALACNLPGTEYAAARAACYGVYAGKVGVGSACKGSVECQRGFFCKGQVDGGAGVCTAIRALGGPCGDNPDHPTEYEESCSYRGSADNGNYCRWYDFGANTDLDAGEWKCTAAGGAASACASGSWCKDTICDPGSSTCKTPDRLFDEQCAQFIK
jgi:hypothetical protein